MYKVIGISFNNSNRIYYFLDNNNNCKKGQEVIVETEKGTQFGTVSTDLIEMEADKLVMPVKPIVRIATKDDIRIQEENKQISKKALQDAKNLAKKLNLEMNFIDASFTFDKNQLMFNFISDNRVDFRELAKKLASIYKTRIELRQIGVRDKAKEIGGLGPCGRFLCCNTFLNDFNSVSINMAKNQYISLNPTKINGLCGRLLCCLKYEDNQYTELKKNFPPLGTIIKHGAEEGKVISHNLYKGTYIIERKDKVQVEVTNEKRTSN